MNVVQQVGSSKRLRTGEVLVQSGVITQEQLALSLQQQRLMVDRGQHLLIGEILVRNRFLTHAQIEETLEHAASTKVARTSRIIIPAMVCNRLKIVPLRVEDDVLVVKAGRPISARDMELLQQESRVKVSSIRVIPADRVELREDLLSLTTQEHSFSVLLESIRSTDYSGSMLKSAIDALLSEALDERSSDIHFDQKSDPDSWISFRIDGKLKQKYLVPERIMGAIFNRIKSDAGMDASDTRRPQDGRINLSRQGRIVDFRIATQPIEGGETMTLRVLDPEMMPSLEALFPNQHEMINLFDGLSKVYGKAGGIILLTGPTGAGKSTTLYALAQRFPRDAVNVVTVENPVEYSLPFARQIQLNPLLAQKAGDVERAILRQDPDILVVGEIRDADTAQTAIKFAESGHRVVATLHATDSIQSIERLVSTVGENSKKETLYVLAHYLQVVINQRLIERLCDCARQMTEEEMQSIGDKLEPFDIDPHAILRHPVGCVRCGHTGYRGRVAAHETLVLPADDHLRQQIAKIIFDSHHRFSEVTRLPGVIHRRRSDTLARLMEAGVVDIKMARRSLGLGGDLGI